MSGPVRTAIYAYDGWDTAKPTATGTENFDVWFETSNYPEYQLRLNGPGIDEVLARASDDGSTTWYATDHQGSIRVVLNDSGASTGTITYTAFGERTATGTGATADLGYASKYWDFTLGLQYNLARWYDPVSGKWLSEDPMSFGAGDANLYRYVANKPTTSRDPSGMQTVARPPVRTGPRPYAPIQPTHGPLTLNHNGNPPTQYIRPPGPPPFTYRPSASLLRLTAEEQAAWYRLQDLQYRQSPEYKEYMQSEEYRELLRQRALGKQANMMNEFKIENDRNERRVREIIRLSRTLFDADFPEELRMKRDDFETASESLRSLKFYLDRNRHNNTKPRQFESLVDDRLSFYQDSKQGHAWTMGLTRVIKRLKGYKIDDGEIADIRTLAKLEWGLHGTDAAIKYLRDWNSRLPRCGANDPTDPTPFLDADLFGPTVRVLGPPDPTFWKKRIAKLRELLNDPSLSLEERLELERLIREMQSQERVDFANNGGIAPGAAKPVIPAGPMYEEVAIVGPTGKLGEFDKVYPGLFVEEKTATRIPKGLPFNPDKTYADLAEKWAKENVYDKTAKRIKNLPLATKVIPEKGPPRAMPELAQLQNTKKFHFKIDETNPDLVKVVIMQVEQLRWDFPGYDFTVEFGK